MSWGHHPPSLPVTPDGRTCSWLSRRGLMDTARVELLLETLLLTCAGSPHAAQERAALHCSCKPGDKRLRVWPLLRARQGPGQFPARPVVGCACLTRFGGVWRV